MFSVIHVASFFFFFKQKTAYEMRISDWSSDVCSSDLLRCLPFAPEENPALGMRGIRFSMQRPDVLATQLRAILRGVPATQLRIMLPMEIGRASCRERVCQSV